ncbi:hypothetical protein FQR65_LT12955 [Abscondita terminalis]|nr:hypothetical protein FQR65_LT12955 [Abscondita terminalis]
MDDFTTSRICLAQIKREPEYVINNDLISSSNLTFEKGTNNTDNSIACHQFHPLLLKEEIKQELLDDEIISDEYVSFNTDIPLIIETSVRVKFIYCYYCNYGTNNKQNLTDHIFTHRLKCNQCSYTAFHNDSLTTHNNVCNYNRSLDEHMISHIGTQVDVNRGSQHRESQASKSLFECHDCGYQTISKITLKRHVKTHRKIGQFLCEVCGFCAHYKNVLKSHILTMHKNFSRNLKIRDSNCTGSTTKPKHEPFKSKIKVDRPLSYENYKHKSIHPKETPFHYNLCDCCNFSGYLKSHSMKREFTCDQCDFKTTTNNILQKHITIHSKEKRLKCSLCDYRSNFSFNLKAHLSKHLNEKPFTCDKCNFRTTTKYNLQTHKLIHSNEKRFKCGLCDFNSNFSYSLSHHLKKHTEGRLHKCDKCDYTTYINSNFQKHKVIHSKEQFNCAECDYKTRFKYNLRQHVIIHFKEKRFKCNLCDFSCNFLYMLKAHLKKH